jgi:hypothetical protein
LHWSISVISRYWCKPRQFSIIASLPRSICFNPISKRCRYLSMDRCFDDPRPGRNGVYDSSVTRCPCEVRCLRLFHGNSGREVSPAKCHEIPTPLNFACPIRDRVNFCERQIWLKLTGMI